MKGATFNIPWEKMAYFVIMVGGLDMNLYALEFVEYGISVCYDKDAFVGAQ